MTDTNASNAQSNKAATGGTSDSVKAARILSYGILLILAALLVFAGSGWFPSHPAPISIGLSALEGLVVLTLSLVGLITVFRALGLTSPNEALGLPNGSVRALLAFSLVIVFVAVASWDLSGGQPLGQPLNSFVLPAAEASEARIAEIEKFYRDQNLIPVLIRKPSSSPPTQNRSNTPAGTSDQIPKEDTLGNSRSARYSSVRTGDFRLYLVTAAGGPSGAGGAPSAAGDEVVIQVYAKRDPAASDLARQVMTVIGTVFVTIVGFYFGSNASADAAATAVNMTKGTLDKFQQAVQGGGAGAPPSSSDIAKTAAAIRASATDAKAKLDKLGSDPLGLLRQATKDPAQADKFRAQRNDAEQAFPILQKQAQICAADADKAEAAAKGVASETDQAKLKEANDRQQQLFREASQAKQQFDDAYQKFTAANEAIMKGTAQG